MIMFLKLWMQHPVITEVKLIEFIYNNFELIGNAVKMVIFGLLSLYLFIKTKNINYLQGDNELKTKQNVNYVYDPAKQKFVVAEQKTVEENAQLKPVYRLNKATGELEKTDEVIDIQELVNSCRDYCLNQVLERFLPSLDNSNNNEVALVQMEDNLDVMSKAVNLANDYKEKYKLDPSLSVSAVFETVKNKATELKLKIKETEEQNNAKKTVEKSE